MWECPCGVENSGLRLKCRGCGVSRETEEQMAAGLPPKAVPAKCRFCHKPTPWLIRGDYHAWCKWRAAHPTLAKMLMALFYTGFLVWLVWVLYQEMCRRKFFG